jgi:hypothetical protein
MSKPYGKLSRADLVQAPVWEWVIGSDQNAVDESADESHVQPAGFAEIPQKPFAQFIVATTIGLKDGSHLPGISELTVAEGRVAVRPTIVFLLDRQLQIPGVETNRLLTRFTKTLENYPVTWKLGAGIEGEATIRSGKIKGGDMKNAVSAVMAVLQSLKGLRS